MAFSLKGKTPERLKLAFELRYRHGYTYLDRCGRAINTIQEYHPSWIVAGGSNQPNANSTNLVDVENGFKFSFTANNTSLVYDRPMQGTPIDDAKVEGFAVAAEELIGVLIDQLSLVEFPRIGCRIWYIVQTQTVDEAHGFLASLGLHDVAPSIPAAFGGTQRSSQFSVVIDGEDRSFRLATETMERAFEVDLGDQIANVPVHMLKKGSGQKGDLLRQLKQRRQSSRQSPAGALIDIDAYQEDPTVVEPAEFIRTSLQLADSGLRESVARTKGT